MILSCGEALIDLIPSVTSEGRESFVPTPGGSPYNTIISIARLGVPAGFIGRISSDFFGDQLYDNLKQNSVRTELITRGNEPTTLAFVKRSKSGEARYAFYTNGTADVSFSPEDIPETLDGSISCIQFGSIAVVMNPAGETIRSLVKREAENRIVSFDPNVRDVLIPDREDYIARFEELCSYSTIVKISDADMDWIYSGTELEAGVNRILSLGVSLVVVTRGADGAIARTEKANVRIPGIKTRVADTVGAGDSFHGGLLSWLHRRNRMNRDALRSLTSAALEDALLFATHVASVTCSRHGADPPLLHELPAELQ